MPVRETSDASGSIDAEYSPGVGLERVRSFHGAIIREGDEPRIEGGVQMSSKEDAVEDVEALGVGLAVGPAFDVARTKELRHRKARDGAAAFPEVEKAVAKEVLADALTTRRSTWVVRGSAAVCFWKVWRSS